jgi:homoserine O-acetyltransferase
MRHFSTGMLLLAIASTAAAQPKPPQPTPHDFGLRDFRFDSGEKLPELRIHYATLGTPHKDAKGRIDNAVLLLHGTTGSGDQFLQPQFAGELFGAGQPLDLSRWFVILVDDIGHGRSSKPSDGLRAHFPAYDYGDMVRAEHELVTKELKIEKLRLLLGTSMGCMHGWMWAERWPDAMEALMPLACLPVQIAGRNRVWRKLSIDTIRQDPSWNGGEYKTQPAGLRGAAAIMLIAGSAPIAWQKKYATRDAAEAFAGETMGKLMARLDANDMIYALDASRDYDPSPELEKVRAAVTFVNSADDFINPPELAIAEREIKRVKRGRFVLIPASEQTRGHGTHTSATFWKDELAKLLEAPR